MAGSVSYFCTIEDASTAGLALVMQKSCNMNNERFVIEDQHN